MRSRARRRAGAGGRSVPHHARRPRRGRRPRARRRRRGPHRDRRLSLVHRLGPRHDDQPRRADACDRPLRRGRLHPAHVRPLHPRRPDPEPVPRRREGRPVPHGRRDAVVLPRARPLRRSTPTIAPRSRELLPKLHRHRRRIMCAARGSASASIPPTACCARARKAISSPGWTRRSATGSSRRGAARRSRSTRSGTTPCACSKAGCARTRRRRRRPPLAAACRARARVVQPALLVRGRAAICTTWSTARRATTPACRPNQLLAISLAIPVLDARAGSRCSTSSRAELLTPVGLRSLAPGHPDYKATVLRRPARARRRLSPGHRLGLADRAVHRCLAEGASGRRAGARRLLDGFDRTSRAKPASARSAKSSTPRRRYTPRGCIAQAWSVAEGCARWCGRTASRCLPEGSRLQILWRRVGNRAQGSGVRVAG